jgi:hypothetical protein
MKKAAKIIMSIAGATAITIGTLAVLNQNSKPTAVTRELYSPDSITNPYKDLEVVMGTVLMGGKGETLPKLLKQAEVVVIGEFVEDTADTTVYHYDENLKRDVMGFPASKNMVKVIAVLSGDVKKGDLLPVQQGTIIYTDTETNSQQIITMSGLTPMVKGQQWIFILGRDVKDADFGYVGDVRGRYPLPEVTADFRNSLKSKGFDPLSAEPDNFGVYDMKEFQLDTYLDLLKKFNMD